MTPPITLSIYIARQFAGTAVGMLLALSGLVALFDFIELLRRSISRPEATFTLVAEIAALRLPYIAMQVLPFAVLLGGMLCFWRLTRSSELVVARAAGVSAWEFLAAPTLCALAFGDARHDRGEPVVVGDVRSRRGNGQCLSQVGGGPLALTGGQLWLRQSDHTLSPQGVAILHAHGVELHGKRLTASQVSVFRLDGRDRLLSRIEAGEATPRRRRMAVAERARHSAGADAGTAGHDQSADRPHRGTRAGELRLARYAVVLGAARLHRAAGPLGIFVDPPPAAFSGAARPAAVLRDHGAGRRRILHASGAARRRGADDRQRRCDRLRIVPGVEDRRGIRPVRGAAGRTCRVGAGGLRS